MLALTACGKGEAGPTGAAATAEATAVFSSRCATCHGLQGRGDGPAAASLAPKPRSFHDAAWQQSVSDDHLSKVILFGGSALGKSPTMPPNPDLSSRPEVVSELIKQIRGMRP